MKKRDYYGLVAALLAVMLCVTYDAHAALFNTAEALAESEVFARDPMFQSVGLLVGDDDELGNGFIAGSGVLIDPYWVLTAGHVAQSTPGNFFESLRFTTNPDAMNNPGDFVETDFVQWFPGYLSSQSPGTGNDIALVRLADPIFDVAPAKVYTGNADLFGIEFMAAGFGDPGLEGTGPGEFDGVRRAGVNLGDDTLAFSQPQYLEADFDNSRFLTSFLLEWQSSPRDSGGGWFADIDDEMQLIAIHSFSAGNFQASGGIQVALYNDFITSTIEANSVPEPGSSVLLLAALLGVGTRRFRKKS